MEQTEKANEVVARIQETAFRLFRQYGFRAITMDEIATQAGMSKKTIYAYFTDKDDLVTTVIKERLKQIQEVCGHYQEKGQNAIDELLQMMEYLNSLFRNMNAVVLLDMQKHHPAAYQAFREHMHGFVLDSIKANLQRGIAEGLFREDIDQEVVCRIRLESCMICFRPETFPSEMFEMSRVQEVSVLHYLYGIATIKGYKLITKYREKMSDK